MIIRAVLSAIAATSLLVACGGGDGADEGSSGGNARRTAVAPERSRANQAEIAWTGRVIEWAREFGGPIETAVGLADEIASTREIPRDVRVELENLFLTVLNCAPTFRSKVGEAPSERLKTVRMTLEGACQKFGAGAAAALEVLDGEPENSRRLLLEEWKTTWQTATDLAQSAAEELIDFQPANARELSVAEGNTLETRIEPRFSAVASSIVDADVEARCWSPVDWASLIDEMESFTGGRIGSDNIGFTGFGDQRVNLAPEACAGLVQLAYEARRPRGGFDQLTIAAGVAALMHEAQHADGVLNEALAECLGMQAIRPAAEKLGADAGYAADLARAYWERVYPKLPPPYQSPECTDGGRLDEHPKSPVWP